MGRHKNWRCCAGREGLRDTSRSIADLGSIEQGHCVCLDNEFGRRDESQRS